MESLYSLRLIRQSSFRALVTERVAREKADCHSRCKGVLPTVSVVATVTRKPQAAFAAYGLLVSWFGSLLSLGEGWERADDQLTA